MQVLGFAVGFLVGWFFSKWFSVISWKRNILSNKQIAREGPGRGPEHKGQPQHHWKPRDGGCAPGVGQPNNSIQFSVINSAAK